MLQINTIPSFIFYLLRYDQRAYDVISVDMDTHSFPRARMICIRDQVESFSIHLPTMNKCVIHIVSIFSLSNIVCHQALFSFLTAMNVRPIFLHFYSSPYEIKKTYKKVQFLLTSIHFSFLQSLPIHACLSLPECTLG